jgi:hypothetical protein
MVTSTIGILVLLRGHGLLALIYITLKRKVSPTGTRSVSLTFFAVPESPVSLSIRH